MAEQTAQDVVTETQLAGDASSADDLGSTQTPLATLGGEEVAVQKEAGTIEDLTESGAHSPSTDAKEELTTEATAEDTTQLTEDRQTDASHKELVESAEARSGEESIESPSAIKDTVSIGEAGSVQGSEDAGHTDTDAATNTDTEAAGKTEGVEAKATSTIKKPAAFKSVSVTKNFLAKSGTPVLAASKTLGDKRRRLSS